MTATTAYVRIMFYLYRAIISLSNLPPAPQLSLEDKRYKQWMDGSSYNSVPNSSFKCADNSFFFFFFFASKSEYASSQCQCSYLHAELWLELICHIPVWDSRYEDGEESVLKRKGMRKRHRSGERRRKRKLWRVKENNPPMRRSWGLNNTGCCCCWSTAVNGFQVA